MSIRIAMWSGPRNISTAMMRSFEARGDCAVTDEPLYAAYLDRTGLGHPMREEIIASQSRDSCELASILRGPVPGGKALWYQKHMTLHMLKEFDHSWFSEVQHAFLIRKPLAVLASYVEKRTEVTLEDIGFVQQRELYETVAARCETAPPVIDADDILANPERALLVLCEALGIDFTPAMLRWPAGRRASDGVWAPAWYQSVERSTGFAPPKARNRTALTAHLQNLADQAQPHYEALWNLRLRF